MAKQVKLTAQVRSETGRSAVKKIKARGFVPAVIYSPNQGPVSLQVNAREIDTLLAHSVGEHVLVEITVEGKPSRLAVMKEVQHHPVDQSVLHVDFYGVRADREFEAEIPVEAVGESDGVKNAGGLLEQLARFITVRCLPKDLPEIIQVDVSALKVGDSLHVRDLALPEGVKAADMDLAIFLVAEPNVVVETPVAAEAPTAPEVIKEKKPAEEAEKKDEKK